MKTEFKLDCLGNYVKEAKVKIIGTVADSKPYVSFRIKTDNAQELSACVPDKDLERLAVNILKALKSKRLK